MNRPHLLASLALAVTASAAGSVLAAEPQTILQKAGCTGCHAVDKKLVGPAYKDIAAKYKGQGDAVAKLSERVRKGGSGAWGTIPMPPNPPERISDADLKAVVEWLLRS